MNKNERKSSVEAKGKSVLFISNVPSPYNVEYLNELGKLINVVAVFERGSSGERDKSWKDLNVKNFECNILQGIKWATDSALSFGSFKYIRKYRQDYIIIGNPSTPTGVLSILYCKLHKIPYILQSEGGFAGTGKGLKEKFKKFLMKDAKLYLTGMKKNDYFMTYGATAEKLKNYPFSSFYKKDILSALPTRAEKNDAKKRIKVDPDKKMILFVGRFVKGKGVDTLIKACEDIEGITLCLVGGEPTVEYLDLLKQTGLQQKTQIVDFIGKEKLKQYYLATDVFVLPTHTDTWGLVINEAMSFGLPIITTKMCVAGLELIKNGENGYLIDVGDYKKLHDFIEIIVSDDDLRTKMGDENLKIINNYSYENMAKVIFNSITETVS